MKKIKTFALIGVILCMLFQTACAGNVATRSNFLLSHYSGADTSNGYDTQLLYMNNEVLKMADTGIIWVPEERSVEYGGWFYQYGSQNSLVGAAYSTFVAEDGKTYREAVQIVRSRDLVDWEICGAVDSGMGLQIAEDEWVWDKVWAAEVAYDPDSGKYFMYFTAQVRELTEDLINKGAKYRNVYSADGTRHYQSEMQMGIAVSDTPVGPFRLATSENVYGDVNATNPIGEVLTGINPTIMFSEYYGMDAEFAMIDAHPFFDENGDFYLFFVKHASQSSAATGDNRQKGNHIWGVKMLDMVTPDYSTLTKLLSPYDFVSVSYLGAEQNVWDDAYPRYLDLSYAYDTTYPDGTEMLDEPDKTVSEAPNVLTTKDADGKTVYLLSYAPIGVGNYNYNVLYAYSYSPLGPYTKLSEAEGRAILQYDEDCNDFCYSVGHAQFLTIGDETWIAYSAIPFTSGLGNRLYAIDRVAWRWESVTQKDGSQTEILLPVANGPSKTLQPKASEISGYRNVAVDAKIKTSSGSGVEYLNDGIVTTTKRFSDMEFVTEEDKVTITLTFDEPKVIRGILVYNSYDYFKAFGSIDSIAFDLAETPASYTKGSATSCYIENLAIDPWTINEANSAMRPGGGAVATFDEIKATSITITISDAVAGDIAEGIAVSDIYVIGQ